MTNSESHEPVVAEQPSTEAGGEEVVNIPKVSGDMGTMFILDLLRQKREKVAKYSLCNCIKVAINKIG